MEDIYIQIKDRPIREAVYDVLRKSICRGELADGSKIAEEVLAKQMNVSRTPIREALRKLEMEGLVEYIPRRGVFVRTFDRREIIEIYQIRMALEQVAVYYVVQNITDSEIKMLEECQERIEKARDDNDLNALFDEYDFFHKTLIRSSRSYRITSLLCAHYDYLQRLRTVTHNIAGRTPKAVNEHRRILEALKTRNLEMLKDAIISHTRSSMKTYLLSQDGIDLEVSMPQVF